MARPGSEITDVAVEAYAMPNGAGWDLAVSGSGFDPKVESAKVEWTGPDGSAHTVSSEVNGNGNLVNNVFFTDVKGRWDVLVTQQARKRVTLSAESYTVAGLEVEAP